MRGTARRQWAASAAVALAFVSLAACGAASGPRPSASLNDGIRFVLSIAPEDIDASQRAILDEVARTGEVTFEQYSDAVNATGACARDAGLIVSGPSSGTLRGLPTLGWGWGSAGDLSLDQAMSLGDACQARYSLYVEEAYTSQPSAVDAEEAILDAKRPEMIACLRKYGVEPLPNATGYDLLGQMADLHAANNMTGPDCSQEINLVL